MMLSEAGEAVLRRVQDLLESDDKGRRFGLRVVRDVSREEDEWIYILVEPGRPGLRAYDFADLLGRIEARVRQEGHGKTLVLPASGELN